MFLCVVKYKSFMTKKRIEEERTHEISSTNKCHIVAYHNGDKNYFLISQFRLSNSCQERKNCETEIWFYGRIFFLLERTIQKKCKN